MIKKLIIGIVLTDLMILGSVYIAWPKSKHNGNEWTKTIEIPDCSANQNMEVIYPQPFNGTVIIECNNIK